MDGAVMIFNIPLSLLESIMEKLDGGLPAVACEMVLDMEESSEWIVFAKTDIGEVYLDLEDLLRTKGVDLFAESSYQVLRTFVSDLMGNFYMSFIRPEQVPGIVRALNQIKEEEPKDYIGDFLDIKGLMWEEIYNFKRALMGLDVDHCLFLSVCNPETWDWPFYWKY